MYVGIAIRRLLLAGDFDAFTLAHSSFDSKEAASRMTDEIGRLAKLRISEKCNQVMIDDEENRNTLVVNVILSLVYNFLLLILGQITISEY